MFRSFVCLFGGAIKKVLGNEYFGILFIFLCVCREIRLNAERSKIIADQTEQKSNFFSNLFQCDYFQMGLIRDSRVLCLHLI